MITKVVKTVAIVLIATLGGCGWDSVSSNRDFLPINDSEYPYANLPRIVIETENLKEVRNTEDYISASLQIYGKDSPNTSISHLKIRGRGTSSFNSMPKYSLKLKFDEKTKILDMPLETEWALISNSADKTLLKNFISLKLFSWLGGRDTPKSQFVELYLNRQYLGVYLLSETIKAGKNRVNIPKNNFSFLFEKTSKIGIRETDIIIKTNNDYLFCIKSPKKADSETQDRLLQHLNDWEKLLENSNTLSEDSLSQWLDIEDYLRFYWVQEFTKNADANFNRSIFITWQKDSPLHYGPVWDFDLAYGNWIKEWVQKPDDWYVRYSGWDKKLFQNEVIFKKAKDFWNNNKSYFAALPDSINKYAKELAPATKNEFKRWPVLENTENWTYKEAYSSYNEAIDSLNSWITQRYQWIDKQCN